MGGHDTDEHGNTRFNCGSAALCHTFIQFSMISSGNKVPLALGRGRILMRLLSALQADLLPVNQVLSQCCHFAVKVTALFAGNSKFLLVGQLQPFQK